MFHVALGVSSEKILTTPLDNLSLESYLIVATGFEGLENRRLRKKNLSPQGERFEIPGRGWQSGSEASGMFSGQ